MITFPKLSLYHYFSLGKLVIGASIILSLYLLIDPFSDPLVALSGVMMGLFLFVWGLSFFTFMGRNRYIRKTKNKSHMISYSYKTSLLFGIYVLFNLVFFFSKKWNIGVGVILLIVFIAIQSVVLGSPSHKKNFH